jgi:hypothetical protein
VENIQNLGVFELGVTSEIGRELGISRITRARVVRGSNHLGWSVLPVTSGRSTLLASKFDGVG